MRRDGVPAVEVRVDADARAARRRCSSSTRPGFGRKSFAGSSAFTRTSIAWPRGADVLLRERQRLARRDPDLLLHEVDAGHELGHRVLDLDPRVHLHEVEVEVLVDQELDRPGVHVVAGLREPDRGVAHPAPEVGRHDRRRRLLDELLVAALHRAVALAEVHDVAVRVGEDLDLDVARPLDDTSRGTPCRRRTRPTPRPSPPRIRSAARSRSARRASRARRRRPPP